MSNKNRQDNADVGSRQPLSSCLVAVCLLCTVLGIIFHFVPSNWAVWNSIKIISASLTVLIVPGVLLLLIIKLKAPLTILEISGLGAALSIGIVTLLTTVCMLTHTSFSLAVTPFVVGLLILGSIALKQDAKVGLTSVTAPASECWLLMGMLVIGFLLFLRGSPLSPGEDQIHIAVARRLAALPNPGISNIYLSSAIVYTYPFPVTHAIFALTSVLGGIDVLFVYHKLRFVWAILAILCVYLATKRLFDNSKLASVSGWTCSVFVANGTFSEVSPLMWAQLAPFSHASDVAMGVLLPLLLVGTFYYLSSEYRRDTFIFLLIALLMSLTLTFAKIREIVQFMVYSFSFLGIIFFAKRNRFLVSKMAVLGGGTLLMVVIYVIFHRLTVASVSSIVDVNRAYILELWRNMSLLDCFARPLNDGKIVNNFNLFFYNLNALALLSSPLIFLAFFRKQLVLFLWAGLFAYLLIIRFPIFSIPYLLLTYFDMLSSPVRNVIFFIFVMTGVIVYMTALSFSKLKQLGLAMILLIGLAFIISTSAERLREILTVQPDWLFLTLLIALPSALWLSFTRWDKSFGNLWCCSAFTARSGICAAVLILSLGFFRYQSNSALTFWKTPIASNVEQAVGMAAAPLMAIQYSVPDSDKAFRVNATSNVPTYGFVQWMKQNVSVKAVCAVNMFNRNILTTFVPQQVPAWPLVFYGPINYRTNFPRFCKLADVAFKRYGTQPFFNKAEQREERVTFLDTLGISHVVTDPSYYEMMEGVLGRYPDLFTKIYDQECWSVFKVNRDSYDR